MTQTARAVKPRGTVTSLLIPLRSQRPSAPAGDGASARPAEDLAVHGPSLTAWVRAVSTSADAALVIDPRGAVVAVSGAAADLLGRPMAELLGHDLARVAGFVDFHADPVPVDQGRTTLAPVQALRHDVLARGLIRFRTPTAELVTCDCVAAPLHDSTRRVIGVLVTLRRVRCSAL